MMVERLVLYGLLFLAPLGLNKLVHRAMSALSPSFRVIPHPMVRLGVGYFSGLILLYGPLLILPFLWARWAVWPFRPFDDVFASWPADLGWGILLGVVGAALIGLVLRWAARDLTQTMPSIPYRFYLPYTVATAIVEELVFRGFAIEGLRWAHGEWHPWGTLLLSALAFGLFHGRHEWRWVGLTGLLGLALGGLYVWQGSLLSVTVAHFLVNQVGLILKWGQGKRR